MRELITEVALDMQAKGIGVFTTSNPGTRTIFTGEVPDSVEKALWLVEVPSPPPHQYIDTEYQMIDIWSQSPHTDIARQQLRQVFDTYHRRNNWKTENWNIYLSQALGNMVDVGRNIEGSKLMRLSVQFICRNLNNIS